MPIVIVLVLTLMSLLTTWRAHAQIAYVSNTEAASSLGTNTVSVSVTVSAGANRGLWLAAYARRSGGVIPAAISGCVFNTSEAFAFVRTDTINSTMAARTELWYLANPTVITANVTCTYANNGTDRLQAFNVIAVTGLEQTSPVDAHNGSNGNGTTASASVTTTTADAWLIDSVITDDTVSITVGSGQTQRSNRALGTGSWYTGSSTVNGKATPGAESMDWTLFGSVNWVLSSAAFKPAGAAAQPRSLMGLGVGR